MAPEIITELGLPIRYVDAVRRPPDGPPWWISAHPLHHQPSTVADRLLGQLAGAEPEAEFFDRQAGDWRAFTTFLLASTTNPASIGGARGWGIGTATPGGIAVSLTNGALLTAGAGEPRDQLTSVLNEWRRAGRPGPADLSVSLEAHQDGWAGTPPARPGLTARRDVESLHRSSTLATGPSCATILTSLLRPNAPRSAKHSARRSCGCPSSRYH